MNTKSSFLRKSISTIFIFIVSIIFVTSFANAQTGPFTIKSSVDKTQAIISITYDISVKPIPNSIRVTVSDNQTCKECYATPGVYWKGQNFEISAGANKALMAVDELKPNTTYYIFVYNEASREYYNSTFKTGDPSPTPPVVNQLPFSISYTSKKDQLTFKITNNGTQSYLVRGDLFVHGTTTSPVKTSFDFGRINSKQVVEKTMTGLKENTRYDLKLTSVTTIAGGSNSTEFFDYKDVSTSSGTGTGSGTTPTGTGSGTTPLGTGTGTTPKDNSVTTGLGLDNPTNVSSIEDFVAKALNVVVDIGTPIVAFFLILSGFMFVAARGNEEKLTIAKRSLVYTLIGAALILGCWGIAQAIKGTVEDVTKTSTIEITKHNA